MSSGDTAAHSARGELNVGTIRTTLQERVDATSLRGVAREVGMTASGLQKVLDGRGSYRSTLQKLRAWHARYLVGDFSTAEEVALEALLRILPGPRRARARELIVAILRGEDPCA
ncbi:MAG: hypothetical protein AB1941_00965 [Gemmatimonadota bacterium]